MASLLVIQSPSFISSASLIAWSLMKWKFEKNLESEISHSSMPVWVLMLILVLPPPFKKNIRSLC